MEKDERIVPAGYDAMYEACLARLFTTNVVATGNLDVTDVKVRKIAQNNPGYVYSRQMFAALINRLVSPKSTSLVYVRGVIVCMGTKSVPEALLACHKYVALLRKQGVLCRLVGFRPYNFVFSVMTFPLNLDMLARDWSYMVQYVRDNFPGATIRCKHMNLDPPTAITIEAFHSGKLNITGATSEEEARRVFEHVFYSVLVHIHISNADVEEIDENYLIDVDRDGDDFVKVITNTEQKEMIDAEKRKKNKSRSRRKPGAAAASASKKGRKALQAPVYTREKQDETKNARSKREKDDLLYEMSKFSQFASANDVDDDQIRAAGEIVDELFKTGDDVGPSVEAGGDDDDDDDNDDYIPTFDDVINEMAQFATF